MEFKFNIKAQVKLSFLSVILSLSFPINIQAELNPKTNNLVMLSNKSDACDSTLKSLKKYLNKLEEKKAANKISSGSFKSYLGSAERNLVSIKKKCPDLNISDEENQLNTYKSDLKNAGGADGVRMANIQKGYYDKAIDNLLPNTHSAFRDFSNAKQNLLGLGFKLYRHNDPTGSYKTIVEAKKTFAKIKLEYADVDFSLIYLELARLEGLLSSESGAEITTTIANENDRKYFLEMRRAFKAIYKPPYNDLEFTADALYSGNTKSILETFEVFSKQNFLAKVKASKENGTYLSVRDDVEELERIFETYPSYISKNVLDPFRARMDDLNNFGIKGDPIKELIVLNEVKNLCKALLHVAPNNPTATKWLNQVEFQINSKTSSIGYSSDMHKNHLGEILFSTKEVPIGNENESNFSSNFKSGDYIYATVYLPAKLRKLTDSYAANDVKFLVNGSIVDQASNTAIWVTTPMQEEKYLQFAVIPSATWKQKNGKPYTENKLRTHEFIAVSLINAGPIAGTKVSVEVIFRGTNSKIKGEFNLDLSGGLDYLKEIRTNAENERLTNTKLPKAGMQNSTLANEAMGIIQRKSKSSKTYTKAIITSVNWGYDKNWNGVILSRSIVVALVSKEYDGKCMYQYFNFKQQAQGDGKYNSNLEFAGAGDNAYISCDNLK